MAVAGSGTTGALSAGCGSVTAAPGSPGTVGSLTLRSSTLATPSLVTIL